MDFILTKQVVDRHGDLVLVNGIDTTAFLKNPIMLFNHVSASSWYRDETAPSKAIGRWENLRVIQDEEGIDMLVATAVFDSEDSFAAEIERKVNDGFLNGVSIGFKAVEHSDEPENIVVGQRYPTIMKSELLEASIVEFPANQEAVSIKNFSNTYYKSLGGNRLVTKIYTDMATKESAKVPFWKNIFSYLKDKGVNVPVDIQSSTEKQFKFAESSVDEKQLIEDVKTAINAQINHFKATEIKPIEDQLAALRSKNDSLTLEVATLKGMKSGDSKTGNSGIEIGKGSDGDQPPKGADYDQYKASLDRALTKGWIDQSQYDADLKKFGKEQSDSK